VQPGVTLARSTSGRSLFIGDYNGFALDGTGRAYLKWTDLRRDVAPGLQISPNRVENENTFFWREP